MPLPDPQPAGLPTISQTEARTLTGLRSFLLGVLPAGTDVVRGQDNRVPEPIGADFVVMTPLMQPRLGTNEVTYYDDVFVGSIAGTTLTVYADDPDSYLTDDADPPNLVTDDATPPAPLTNDDPVGLVLALDLGPGMVVRDRVAPEDAVVSLRTSSRLSVLTSSGSQVTVTTAVVPGTAIVRQLTGTPGGAGTYEITLSQYTEPEVMYVGVRQDLVPTEYTIQLDVHGPRSGDSTRIIEGLFRSEYATDFLDPYGVSPLYCSDPRQAPFVNDQDQVEYRWSLDAHLQVNPTIGTPQEFATEVFVDPLVVAPVLAQLPLTTSSGLHVQAPSGHQVLVGVNVG